MNEQETKPIEKKEITRREFLGRSWRNIGWIGFIIVSLGSIIASIRFFFPKVLNEELPYFKAGRPEDFEIGTVTLIDKKRAWIAKDEEGFYAIIAICTHLGCQPNWFANEGIFKCPCHGSQYNIEGINFAGPAPRPMDRAHISLKDEELFVDKSKIVSRDYRLKI